MTTYDVLRAVRIKGLSSTEMVAELSGLSVPEVESHLAAARADGLVDFKDGRIAGWRLSAEGRTAWSNSLTQERSNVSTVAQVAELYRGTFLSLNTKVKQLCTDWQLRPAQHGEMTINDHADAEYDGRVIARLAELHQSSTVPLMEAGLSPCLPRLGRYRSRLDDALADVSRGEHRRFTAPMANSYHDIWMELHEDLVLFLAIDRKAEESAR